MNSLEDSLCPPTVPYCSEHLHWLMFLASCRNGLGEGIGAESVLEVTGTTGTTLTGAPGLLLRCCQVAGVHFILSVCWADILPDCITNCLTFCISEHFSFSVETNPVPFQSLFEVLEGDWGFTEWEAQP